MKKLLSFLDNNTRDYKLDIQVVNKFLTVSHVVLLKRKSILVFATCKSRHTGIFPMA